MIIFYFITKHMQGYPSSTLGACVGSLGERGCAAEEVASGSLPMAGPAPLALAQFHPEEVITLQLNLKLLFSHYIYGLFAFVLSETGRVGLVREFIIARAVPPLFRQHFS
jgi:hypothetical protein